MTVYSKKSIVDKRKHDSVFACASAVLSFVRLQSNVELWAAWVTVFVLIRWALDLSAGPAGRGEPADATTESAQVSLGVIHFFF